MKIKPSNIPNRNFKSFPYKGNLVYVEYVTNHLLIHSFMGICSSTAWSHENSSFVVVNAYGFKQKFFFFSPLVTSVKVLHKPIKKFK
jgi:hypothetical protein